MIGFIAGAGIVVRNSIILVDFIEMRRGEGVSLADAVEEAGAVRFRPMTTSEERGTIVTVSFPKPPRGGQTAATKPQASQPA